jgi:hypothetical protein
MAVGPATIDRSGAADTASDTPGGVQRSQVGRRHRHGQHAAFFGFVHQAAARGDDLEGIVKRHDAGQDRPDIVAEL